jgi:hypothetical protein
MSSSPSGEREGWMCSDCSCFTLYISTFASLSQTKTFCQSNSELCQLVPVNPSEFVTFQYTGTSAVAAQVWRARKFALVPASQSSLIQQLFKYNCNP